jgi:methionyl-tRNA synthetase
MFSFPLWLIGILLILAVWSIVWKGWALWLAARNGHTTWFIVLLVVNTVAILEIFYIFGIGRPEALKKAPPSAQ